MAPEFPLRIIDDLAPAALFEEAARLGAAKGWYFGHGSHDGDAARFWKIDLDGIPVFDAIWNQARAQCEEIAGGSLRVLRQYGNGHTYGLGGQPHFDDSRPGAWTLLYYPMAEWREEWEGETVFYDEKGEIVLSVRPRPNRAVFFDSRILHAGRSPGRQCTALRVTVAYKLQQELTPEPAAVAAPGLERRRHVHIPAGRMREGIAEHLTRLGESLRLPGFRPGHIPMAVLEQRYGADARTKVLDAFIAEAAAGVPEGSIVINVDVQGDSDVTLELTLVHLPDLAEPEVSELTLDRLTGLSAEAQQSHLKQQMLDYLERSYPIRTPQPVVDRELAAIMQAAESSGQDRKSLSAEFRALAERRVRLGMVVAELARRCAMKGPGVEDQVLDRLISQARIHERPATAEELGDLD